ncbi:MULTISPECIES: F0F1 ATP synthase subunit delta [unclassified Salinibacterium]|uniref:F0F1 ATP synthase subunit delta n=1 Tax=unclassified Salinibacterium TaxID=2632331 RepID=UPI0018CD850E|nr:MULTISPECIES: F0F1 ATP synthase subunit delta [unclassified Salinibacterium]MBH0055179.1 F0F1 ATP synthase subunit delta [Salinibacterium sp. SWN139]MBH0084526.1 F0F1 ATP synthase subunit delta [Salinibacterium sp. SWN167]
MGSATREALVAAKDALSSVTVKNSLATGAELFEAGRVVGDSAQLRSALADPAAAAKDKAAIVGSVFSSLSASARTVLTAIVSVRWSDADDLLAGIEEIGIRAIAKSAPAKLSIDDELFAFGDTVSSDAELELAVGSKLGSAASKSSLVRELLAGKASDQSIAIIDQLVQQPRGRRIGELVATAADIVADQAGKSVATITTAAPLKAAQLERLRAGLTKNYGRELKLNVRIDPSLIGGVRVQIGDEVIDGSVSTKLNDLRIQLAG